MEVMKVMYRRRRHGHTKPLKSRIVAPRTPMDSMLREDVFLRRAIGLEYKIPRERLISTDITQPALWDLVTARLNLETCFGFQKTGRRKLFARIMIRLQMEAEDISRQISRQVHDAYLRLQRMSTSESPIAPTLRVRLVATSCQEPYRYPQLQRPFVSELAQLH
jgi:hypothetical protein